MKTKIIIVSIFLLVCLIVAGCNIIGDSENDYAGIAIYKTNGDYFNLVDVGMKGDKFIRTESFWNSRYNTFDKMKVVENDTIYVNRYKLAGGYILDLEAVECYDVFLSLTFKEYLLKEIGMGQNLSHDTLREYILDANPYIEFYSDTSNPKIFLPPDIINDTAKINSIIRNGELGKYFERLR